MFQTENQFLWTKPNCCSTQIELPAKGHHKGIRFLVPQKQSFKQTIFVSRRFLDENISSSTQFDSHAKDYHNAIHGTFSQSASSFFFAALSISATYIDGVNKVGKFLTTTEASRLLQNQEINQAINSLSWTLEEQNKTRVMMLYIRFYSTPQHIKVEFFDHV